MTTPAPSGRRWFRFSLGMLFALVTIACIAIGLWRPLQIVRERQAMRSWLPSRGGQVIYIEGVWERYARGHDKPGDPNFRMPFLRTLVGDEKAVLVVISTDGSLSDDEIARIRRTFPEAGIWFRP